MKLSESAQDGVVVVQPQGRIDNNSVKAFGDRIVEVGHSAPHRIVIDFQATSYINSGGFRALLIARKQIEKLQGRLVLCGMPAEIERLFEIAAIADAFVICRNRDEGIAKAQS
jgi:anti-anti-sigma factor